MNRIQSQFVHANNVNLCGKNTNISNISKEVGTELNTCENTYLLMAHHQNPEQNHTLKMTNKFSQNNNKAQNFRQ